MISIAQPYRYCMYQWGDEDGPKPSHPMTPGGKPGAPDMSYMWEMVGALGRKDCLWGAVRGSNIPPDAEPETGPRGPRPF